MLPDVVITLVGFDRVPDWRNDVQAQFKELQGFKFVCPRCPGAAATMDGKGWTSKSNGMRRVMDASGPFYLLSYGHSHKDCPNGDARTLV